MNRIFIILNFFLLFSVSAYAQIGIGTDSPDPAAELDVVSPKNNTGVLIPVFTDAQISASLTPNQPTHGSLIFNSTKNKFMYNAGTATSPQWAIVGQAPLCEDVTAITAPFEGDLRFDLATNTLRFYNGTVWKTLQP